MENQYYDIERRITIKEDARIDTEKELTMTFRTSSKLDVKLKVDTEW